MKLFLGRSCSSDEEDILTHGKRDEERSAKVRAFGEGFRYDHQWCYIRGAHAPRVPHGLLLCIDILQSKTQHVGREFTEKLPHPHISGQVTQPGIPLLPLKPLFPASPHHGQEE